MVCQNKKSVPTNTDPRQAGGTHPRNPPTEPTYARLDFRSASSAHRHACLQRLTLDYSLCVLVSLQRVTVNCFWFALSPPYLVQLRHTKKNIAATSQACRGGAHLQVDSSFGKDLGSSSNLRGIDPQQAGMKPRFKFKV